MSCGLKKQNNNEGGVHLTERTCSPYNPIIKLIVDDCLGLPIYPVSSIDAVIDEDGKTLRQLLDELIDEIKGGTSDVQTLIENIQNKFEQYLSKIEFNTAETERLKSLLWAISALSDINTLNEDNLYAEDRKTPKIVNAVKKLQEDLKAITNGGSGLSLLGLSDAIRSLKEILLAVANYNEEYTVNSNDPSGLEPSRLEKIKIIQEIIDIKSDIKGLSELIGGNPGGGGGSITLRVKELETQVTNLWNSITRLTGRIDALEEEAKGHAHLDPEVLNLMPEGTTGKAAEVYLTLKIGEYPPTTVDFIRYNTVHNTGERLEYLGFFNGEVVIDNDSSLKVYDLYPFGHTFDFGNILYYKTGDGHYTLLLGENGKPLRAGNGTITKDDVDLIADIYLGKSPEYKESPVTHKRYDELFYNDGTGNYYRIGDIDKNGEVNIGDVNNQIKELLNSSTEITIPPMELPSNYSTDRSSGWLMYYKNDTLLAAYPCIEGKLYSDSFTGLLYQYSNGTMYPVAKDEFIGTKGIDIKQSLLYSGIKNNKLVGPYNLYKISIADDTLPNTITCKYINDLSSIENDTEDFEYFLYEGLYLVIPSLGVSDTDITINGSTVEVKHNIGSVTALIDSLLGGGYSTLLKTTVENKKAALLDWVEDKIAETPGTDKDALDKLNYIKDHILGLSPIHTINSILTIEVLYAEKNNGSYTLNTFVVTDPYYALNAFCAFWDFNVDSLTNIGDVTSLIDSLLSSELGGKGKYSLEPNGPYPYINPVALGASIWIKTDELPQQVVPLGATNSGHQMLVEGRLFRVIHSHLDVTNYDWYYFDDTYAVRPLNPKFDLDYNSTTGYLSLYQNGVEIDGIQTNLFPKNIGRTSNPGGTYEIRNLGKNSTPYLFGTWRGEHLSCFLNSDMSVIKDAKVSVTMDDISRIFSVDEILDKSAWFDKNDGNLVRIQPSGLTFSLACPDVAFTELKDYSMFKYVGSAPYTSDFTEKIRNVLEKHIKSAHFSKSAAEITAAFNTDNEYTLTYWCLGPEGYLYKVLDYIKVTMSEEALSEILSDNSEKITHELLALILLEAITLNANMTIIDSERLDPNTIYYFPKFGLQIRFEVELVEIEGNIKYTYHPVIVQVESKEYDKNHMFTNFIEGQTLAPTRNNNLDVETGGSAFTETVDTTPRKKAALIYPNEHLDAGPVDSIYFDCGRLENIPGFKYIDVHGSFKASIDHMSLTLGSSYIRLNDFNPSTRAGHIYEYHIFNGVFSFKDISPFNPASSSPTKPPRAEDK